MLFYLSIYAAWVPFLFFPKKQSGFFLALLTLFFIFFVGFRHEVGGDWGSYLLMYEQIGQSTSWSVASRMSEPLYAIINWFSYRYGWGIYFVNLICAFIFLYGLVKFCQRQYNPMLGLLVALPYLVFVVAMGYTRQSAALGVAFLALNALMDKKDFRFIILVFVATGFHMSAIVMLGFLIVRLKAKYFFRFAVVSGVLFALAFYFVGYKLIGKLDLYTGGGLDSKGAFMRLGLNLIPAVFFIVKRNAFKKMMPNAYLIAIWLSIGSIGLFLLAFIFTTIADRLGLYFSFIQVLIFANLPALIRADGRLLYYFGVVAFYVVFLLVWLSTSYYAQNFWIPYDNILL